MDTTTVLKVIASQREAWKAATAASIVLNETLEALAAAKARCADLRANDSGEVAKLAKALGEQADLIEIAEARRVRLSVKAEEAKAAAVALTFSPTLGVISDAREAIFSLRHIRRAESIIAFFGSWISMGARDEQAHFLKHSAYELAYCDSGLSGREELGQFSTAHVTSNNPHLENLFESNARFIEAHMDELKAGLDRLNAINEENQKRPAGVCPPLHAWSALTLPNPQPIP